MVYRILLLTCGLLMTFLGFAQQGFIPLSSQQYQLLGSYRAVPQAYQAFDLDKTSLTKVLLAAPMEQLGNRQQRGKEIYLPWPDGKRHRFEIFESPILEAGLASRFPQIKTYIGRGLDDARMTARLSMTPIGFQAIIHSTQGTVYIDPYPANPREVYFSYFKKDYQAIKSFAEEILPEDSSMQAYTGTPMQRGSGDVLRSYRIAISATGEYTSFHGGTLAGALSAITTTLNRAISIYEQELAIRFTLINNNDRIIYLDGNTDPFTNGSPVDMIAENQIVIDREIGDANYDIGHIFGLNAGGLASTGVICQTGSKAQGVTGTATPIGDPFDVDYVAHEIGHQFTALHTFNGRRGSCGGNRTQSTAFEPGSGSTIMGYAGICGRDNIQNNSDDYFHYGSYDQIITYVNNLPTSCGTSINTGNSPPSLGIKLGETTIPMMTPFELEALGNDPDGDVLTYCWEQVDTGPAGDPESPQGSAPMFRSFPPQATGIRVFPRMEDILNNTTTLGEVIPTYSRSLNFFVTARDNNMNGGGVESFETELIVTDLAGPFVINFPSDPNTLTLRSDTMLVPINWNVNNTDLAPVSCAAVDITLSLDGGKSFPFTLAQGVPNTGLAMVNFPFLPTDSARVKIKAVGNVFFTVSANNFPIELSNVRIDPTQEQLPFEQSLTYLEEEQQIQLNITAEQGGTASLGIFDLGGKKLLDWELRLQPHQDMQALRSVAALPRGMYVCRIQFAGKSSLRKFIVY